MGYTKAKTANGSSAIEWNEEINDALCTEHNIFKSHEETPAYPESQETPETPVIINNNNNKEKNTLIDEILGVD